MFEQNKKTAGCRTVKDVMEVFHEKNGGLNEFLHSAEQKPVEIRGMAESISLITEAMDRDEPVSIIGDYDVDGIMATIILYLSMLIKFRKKAKIRLPHRFSEGYGLSVKIIDEIESGTVFCVDNGIAAVEQIKAAKEKGLKVIVMDHHLIRDDGKLPECDVLIDPHIDKSTDFDDYCGAGLAYRFAVDLLGEGNPYLPDLLVMASIATVADMVELKQDNRKLLSEGITAANSGRGTFGLRYLLSTLGVEHIDEDTYGFLLGPICNASGRLYDNGAEKVFSQLYIMNRQHDPADLLEQTTALIETNKERKKMVREVMNTIPEKLQGIDTSSPIVIEDDIPEGIVGIIAGNLAEEYRVPVLVFTKSAESDILKGSGRSGDVCNLKKLLDESSSLFVKYGGHAGAAGMSIQAENLCALRKSLAENFARLDVVIPAGKNVYDLEINPSDIPGVIEELKKYAPFGKGNPKPRFLVRGFECTPVNGSTYRVMGENSDHVKLYGNEASAIGFWLAERYKSDGYPKKIDILGTLSENYYNGKVYPQIKIEDYEPVKPKISDVQKSLMELLMF